ncbi:DUF3750 domain-containing protein [Verrucomicrobiaceae bacterium 227]
MISKALIAMMTLSFTSCHHRTIHPEATVVIKDVRIPKGMPWYARFASHSFIDFRSGDSSTWRRVEIVNKNSGITVTTLTEKELHEATRWNNPVHIVSQGSPPAAATAAAIEQVARTYNASLYRPYPGPNSNTFTREIIMKVPEFHGVLEHNAIGKEFTWHAGRTPGGTGLELKTPVLGTAIGLREGIEVNLLGFTTGVGIWPPSLKIPFLPQLPLRPAMAPTTTHDSRNQ